jgi:hypothetical protein
VVDCTGSQRASSSGRRGSGELVQGAIVALRDGEPDGARRAEVALTVALGALTRLTTDFDRAAKWLANGSLAPGGSG